MKKLYGTEPVFIFDPEDDSNRPVKGYHDNAIIYWELYPEFFKKFFIKSFTEGIREPEHGRVREGEWRPVMIRLMDSIIYCGHCKAENFYDADKLKATGGKHSTCWSCRREVVLPFRIRIGKNVVMLNSDSKLFLHHVDGEHDLSTPIAEVAQHPSNPGIWGLKNLSGNKWVRATPEGENKEIIPGQSATLAKGIKIQFGMAEGEINY
jgi:hypothetical protein